MLTIREVIIMARKARKRGSGAGSIAKRGNTFTLRIMVNGKVVQRAIKDPITGKRAETKMEAERLASAMAADLFSGGKLGLYDIETKRISLSALNEKYKEAFSSRWDKGRLMDWNRYVSEMLRSFKYIDDITHESLGKHVKKRLDTPKERGEKPRSVCSVNRELSVIKRLLNWGTGVGILDKNPTTGFPLLKEPRSRDRILSPEEIARLLTALENPVFSHIRLIVRIAITTGMRREEILTLKWAAPEVPKQENVVDVKRGVFDLQKTKSRERQVPIPLLIKDELKQLSHISPYVFPSPVNEAKPISEIKHSFHSLLKEAKIQGVRFHDLRHCAASAWVDRGVDIRTVQELLGHASITTTERYLTSKKESKQKAMEITSNILGGKND